MRKIVIIIGQVIAITALIIGIFLFIRWIKRMEKKIDAANAVSEQIYRQHASQVTSVVRSELKLLYPRLDSIVQASGIKEKHIENITNIYHEYKYDTIPVQLTADSGMKMLNVSMTKDCFKANGSIDFAETAVSFLPDDIPKIKMQLTDVQLIDTTTTIYFFNRKIVRILFIPLRIGRKQYFSETSSTCKAETKTEGIKLIKR